MKNCARFYLWSKEFDTFIVKFFLIQFSSALIFNGVSKAFFFRREYHHNCFFFYSLFWALIMPIHHSKCLRKLHYVKQIGETGWRAVESREMFSTKGQTINQAPPLLGNLLWIIESMHATYLQNCYSPI